MIVRRRGKSRRRHGGAWIRVLAGYGMPAYQEGTREEHSGRPGRSMGRTSIDIDDDLLRRAIKLTGARTKREAVEIALRRLVEKGSLYRSLRKLRGKLPWEGDIAKWRRART